MGAERRWLPAIVLAASTVALLATSPAHWEVTGTITGPKTPSPGRALLLSIEASQEPEIRATGFPATYTGLGLAPCLERLVGGKMTCLLPPDSSFTTVDLDGRCSGCKTCAPPPGAFARTDSKEVDVWIDGDTSKTTATLPSHGKGFIASRFKVLVSGASFVTVKLIARPRGGGTPIFDQEQSCGRDDAAGSTNASCIFLVYDSSLGSAHDVDVTADATGYGTCAAKRCAPPKTLKIDSLAVLP